ncbi:hypothetical protein Bca52824_001871 [Brassica carinata]|uniref:Uncharacterized protein n=1 Tax=Brassica carinata TaxID=52824 RepID=A0A8X7WI61_BRACI|nr:hypothetical protein Bca52824_001871 [Brassica carinata]
MDLDEDHLPIHPSNATLDIHGVEADPKLRVTALIPLESQPHPGWGIWPDVCDDDSVSYMEQLIADRQPFTKSMWPGGDTSEPFITFPSVVVIHENKKRSTHSRKPGGKNIKQRHCIKKTSSARKQRRISTYFSIAAPSISQHEQLLAILSGLSSQFNKLHQQFNSFRKQLRRSKRRSSCKRSSFHSLLLSSKTCNRSDKGCQTCNRSDKGCQTDLTNSNSDAADNNIVTFLACLLSLLFNTCTFISVIFILQPETDMDVDGTTSLSPMVSQYAAQHYLQIESTTRPPVQGTTVHNASQQPSLVHITPVQNPTPVQSSPVHDSDLEMPKSQLPSASAQYDTSAAPLDLHHSLSPTPKSPPFQDLLFSGVEIHSPICPDPITPTQPRYDSSANPASRRVCLFPLSTQTFSPERSPTKSPASITGFAVHAAGLNAFSATSTSHSPVSNTTVHVDEPQPADNTEIVEVSDCDGTPPRQTPTYFPCMEENYVSKELFRSKDIPVPTLICQLPQIQWDLFYKSISKFGET